MTTNRTRIWLVSVLNFSQIWGWRSYFFPKSQAGHDLKMFLNFWEISASRSYKLGSYEKKKVYINAVNVGMDSVTNNTLKCYAMTNLKNLSIIKVLLNVLDDDSILCKFIVDPIQKNLDKLFQFWVLLAMRLQHRPKPDHT